jgi:cell division protein FtsW (lipid II flippase)
MKPDEGYGLGVLLTVIAVVVIFCAGFPVTLVIIVPAIIGAIIAALVVKDI